MAEKHLVQCDYCKEWFDKKLDQTYGHIIFFDYPWKWFVFRDKLANIERGFCSGECMRAYVNEWVDTMSPEIRNRRINNGSTKEGQSVQA